MSEVDAERSRIADECDELARRIEAGIVTAPPARVLRDLANDLRFRIKSSRA